MFTGLVEEIGVVESIRRGGRSQVLSIRAERVPSDAKLGDSISIDGACQTVTEVTSRSFSVETLATSLEKTTFAEYRSGRRVNLERSLTPSSRIGGHFVQGHVDGTATVRDVREEDRNVYFTVELPPEFAAMCIQEGSIAIDGVSLTIARLEGRAVTINVIPSTWRDTVLVDRSVGDRVNIEIDVLARYVARLLTGSRSAGADRDGRGAAGGLTTDRLLELGYGSKGRNG
jgi:riboflavin synthase